ncbi:DUF6417 family protein [Streptomyces sp. 2-6]|uniref:DUF6417 family protein n=1 Tax=Streptomyces sp. 2-6 TaxID=2978333 RepID=UPI003D13FBA4
MRAELSAREGRPVRWAARLPPVGHDVLTYPDAGQAPVPQPDGPADGEQLVELRPAEMGTVRRYVQVGERLRVRPADGLAERVRGAAFDRSGNRWSLFLTGEQIESVAYALYLHSVGGSVAEANRFARTCGLVFRAGRETGVLQLEHLS